MSNDDVIRQVFAEITESDRAYGVLGEPELDRFDESELDRYEIHLAQRYSIELPTHDGLDGLDYARARQAIRRAVTAEQDARTEPQAEAFVCPICLAASHHPTDIAQGYCANCHDWTGGPA